MFVNMSICSAYFANSLMIENLYRSDIQGTLAIHHIVSAWYPVSRVQKISAPLCRFFISVFVLILQIFDELLRQ